MIISRSFYVAEMALFHSFLWLSNVPVCVCMCVCVCVCVYTYYIFSIQSFVDGHLGCLHALTVVKSVAYIRCFISKTLN